MNRYLVITIVSAVLISSLVYSIVYTPEIQNFFKGFISPKEITKNPMENEASTEITSPVYLIDTLPNLSISASDNFKTIKFGDLNLKVNSEYTLSEAPERINLKLDDVNEIQGYYYPLTSEPRKDIDTSSFVSELVKNNYTLSKKSNIPDKFVKDMFDLGVGSTVQDRIEGKIIDYIVKDVITFKTPNLGGFFFNSEKEEKYKVIILSPTKLYIFNITSTKENFLKTQKTFYNIDKIE